MRIILTILLVVLGVVVKGQPTRPAGLPVPYAPTGYYRIAWLKADSGLITAYRDTSGWFPRFTGTIVTRPQDNKPYFYDSSQLRWYRLAFLGDPAGSVAWGTITGTLTAQTDLYDSLLQRFRQNGNSFGDTARLGTNDNFPLAIELNNQRVFTFTGTPIPSQPSSIGSGGLWIPGGGISLTGVNPSANSFRIGETLTFSYGSTAVGAAQNRIVTGGGSDAQYTSSEGSHIFASQNFLPASGNAIFNYLKLDGTIIQSGGANGITRGLHVAINPTGAADFRAIQTDSGNILLNTLTGRTAIGLFNNNPLAKLHVVGTGLFTDTLTAVLP